MASRLKIADISEIAHNQAKTIEAQGKKISIFNLNGAFFAIEDTCPHRGGPLSEGNIEGDWVACPWHAARFNIKTGEASGPPAPRGVTTYPVILENRTLYIELP